MVLGDRKRSESGGGDVRFGFRATAVAHTCASGVRRASSFASSIVAARHAHAITIHVIPNPARPRSTFGRTREHEEVQVPAHTCARARSLDLDLPPQIHLCPAQIELQHSVRCLRPCSRRDKSSLCTHDRDEHRSSARVGWRVVRAESEAERACTCPLSRRVRPFAINTGVAEGLPTGATAMSPPLPVPGRPPRARAESARVRAHGSSRARSRSRHSTTRN